MSSNDTPTPEAALGLPWKLEEDEIVEYNPRQKSPFADRGGTILDATGREVIVGGCQDEQGGAVGVLTKRAAAHILRAANSHFALVAQNAALASALRPFVDNEPCRFDHHGYCQTHRLGNPCEVAVARELLATIDAATLAAEKE